MIQDISPSRLDNSFRPVTPEPDDFILHFDPEGRLLTCGTGQELTFPSCAADPSAIYLFSVDEQRYFLSRMTAPEAPEGASYRTVRELRDNFSGKELYAAFTAFHLWKWYSDNRFCGKCGAELVPDSSERALACPLCGGKIYPRINPAVIVGVTNGDRILITRYRRGYAHNALVAGFTEIGETLEQTVEREVMEETGVRVKNIRYYKSQPWGMAQDILVGFFCDADGGEIHMDENELKYAEWVCRPDIVLQPYDLSLTNEMMKVFRDGLI
ncbi:NAD+ diphosphatase [Ruminococcus sp. YE71]|uniref:NAD(+) diphosphatase n=1 Tax=unclassified Ruminococcus TaxID=2608920 RepID=UPI00088ADF60|nr:MULTISPECIES: NAD(+) diphosphatase [unclassified Ruminococcus]SDA10102.1 NAD+ diphosphatase [Ruminococcus sp. YE78]SFW11096.1 NAD+ diphosphatase [Ruminococcus sp. YE71]